LAAIAGGAGAAGAAAAVAAAVFLLRKKKPPSLRAHSEETATTTTTFDDKNQNYVSEYGLSDGRPIDGDSEPGGDLPPPVEEFGGVREIEEVASEHNPEELEWAD
jgi:hypothetical protein